MESQNPFESQIQNQSESQLNQQNETLQQIAPMAEGVDVAQQNYQMINQPMEYAGFWARFAANIVDGIVLIIPSTIVQSIYGKNLGGFMSYVLMWAYAIYMLTNRQATLGKMAVGLKVTKVSGEAGTTGTFAMREILGKIVNMITLGIGYLMIAFTEKKQGLHDMIADTVVVFDPARKRRQWLIVLGIVFSLIIPIGILAGVVLVSTNNARQKALDNKVKAEQRAVEIQKQVEKK